MCTPKTFVRIFFIWYNSLCIITKRSNIISSIINEIILIAWRVIDCIALYRAVTSWRIVSAQEKFVKCFCASSKVNWLGLSRKVSTLPSTEEERKELSTFRFSIGILTPDMAHGVNAIDFLKLTEVLPQRGGKRTSIYNYDGQSSPVLSVIRKARVRVNWIDKIRRE